MVIGEGGGGCTERTRGLGMRGVFRRGSRETTRVKKGNGLDKEGITMVV